MAIVRPPRNLPLLDVETQLDLARRSGQTSGPGYDIEALKRAGLVLPDKSSPIDVKPAPTRATPYIPRREPVSATGVGTQGAITPSATATGTAIKVTMPITQADLDRIAKAKALGQCVGTMKTYYTVKTYKVTLVRAEPIYVEALSEREAKLKAKHAGYKVVSVRKVMGWEKLPTAEQTETPQAVVETVAGVTDDSLQELQNYDTQYGTHYADIAQNEGYTAVMTAINTDNSARNAILVKLDKYKTDDGRYDLLRARRAGITTNDMRQAGFDDATCQWVEDSYQTSVTTGVALPGDKTWYNPQTGETVSDAEYQQRVIDFNRKVRETAGTPAFYELGDNPGNVFALSPASGRRLIIEGISTLFFAPARALLPEVKASDIEPITWAVGAAQLATWAMPVIPKGVLPVVSGGAAGVLGYSTAKNWGQLSTLQKVLSVAGTALVALPALARIGGPAAVKVPTTLGTEVTVWRGIQVNGKPIFGISQGKPTFGQWGVKQTTLAQVEAGWHPVTKIETTLLGTENALRKMGVAEDDIVRVRAVWKEAIPMFARKGTPAKVTPTEILAGSQRLTPEETAAILQVSAKNPKVKMIYGSSTMRPQLKEALRNWRQWHDIDIQTSMTASELETYVATVMRRLRQTGAKVRVNPEQPGTIEKFAGGKWEKITDIHTFEETPSSVAATEGAYGYLYAEKPITINLPGVGKLKLMTLSETGLRKGGSITSFQTTKIGPAAHRINDIADFYTILVNYKGPAIADRWAKAFGYTSRQLAEVAARNPQRWSSWSLSPSVSAARAMPSVSIAIPASLAGSIPASLRADIQSYSPMVEAASYMVSASPASVRSVSPSGKVSPSTLASPSARSSASPSPKPSPSRRISPSPSRSISARPSPSISPKASPSPSPSPAPSPSPSPSPSPTPSPSPSPYPSPGPSPKPYAKRHPISLDREQRRPPETPPLLVWRQGMYWVSIYPGFRTTGGKPDVVYSRHRPVMGVPGKGRRSPMRTLRMKGNVPQVVELPMGVVTARVRHGTKLVFTRRGKRRGKVVNY